MKKKIHIWCPNFRTFGGGIGSFTKQLHDSIDRKKNIISVISKNDLKTRFDNNQNILIFQLEKFFKLIVFISRIILKFFTQKPELIITTHIHFSVLAYLTKILFKIQYIVVAHGLEINSRISKFQLVALNNSEKIISVSRWTQNRLLKLGININKIVIIGNAVPKKIFHPKYSTKNLKYFYKIKSNEKIILTVSRLDKKEKYKGYDLIIKAMVKLIKKFKNIRYLIVGGGDDQERIKILIRKLKLEKSILLCGFVTDNKLPYYYCLADIFALPSTGEGFGIVFLESMLSGTPVISGNKDGSVDAIQNGYLGKLVNPCKVASITQGITDLLKKKGPKFWYSPKKLRKACLFFHNSKIFSKKINYEINNIKFNKI